MLLENPTSKNKSSISSAKSGKNIKKYKNILAERQIRAYGIVIKINRNLRH